MAVGILKTENKFHKIYSRYFLCNDLCELFNIFINIVWKRTILFDSYLEILEMYKDLVLQVFLHRQATKCTHTHF